MDVLISVDAIQHMHQAEIENLFRRSSAGPIPSGEGQGTVIVAPDTVVTETAAKVAHLIAWKGKVFDPESGTLRNEIGPLGNLGIKANVYKDVSWFDGDETIVLDYSKTSLVAHWVRDEIREVAPGLYLGIVYWEKDKILDFTLQFGAGE